MKEAQGNTLENYRRRKQELQEKILDHNSDLTPVTRKAEKIRIARETLRLQSRSDGFSQCEARR